MFYGRVTEYYSKEPLRGVPVTDGRNIALTDENGEYSLPGWERARVISVGVLTKRHNDWFRMIENGVFDFAIRPAETENDFCFLHCSDTEIENREHVEWIDFLRSAVKEYKPAFFADTGDLCRDDGVDRHYLLCNSESVGCPVRYAIGNHDFIGEDYGEQSYERLYGPTWYSFDCGDTHFAVLSIGRGEKPSGYEKSDQWIWLENDLELNRGKRLVILDHDLCNDDPQGFAPVIDGVKYDLRAKGLCAWVFGHYHYNYLNVYGGVVSACTAQPDMGGIDSSAAALRVVSVKNGGISSKLVYDAPFEAGDLCLWRANIDGNIAYCSPVCEGNRLYTASADDGFPKNCGVYCLDTQSGDILWQYKTENSVKNELALDSDTVYAVDCSGTLYALDKLNGDLRYSVKLTLGKAGYTEKAPLIAGNKLIAGSQSEVYALDKRTGAALWHSTLKRDVSSPARFVYDPYRGSVLISSQWYGLISLDADTGEIRWEQKDQPLWFRSSAPLVTEKAIFTCGLRSFTSVDPLTGGYIKVRECGFTTDAAGAPLLDRGVLYYPTGEGGVVAVDPETMAPVRKYPTGAARVCTVPYTFGQIQTVEGSPVLLDKYLCFTASDGYLYVYEKSAARLIRKTFIGAPSLVSPAVVNDGIITADLSGRITKFKK